MTRLNLLFRFILEVIALVSSGVWGYSSTSSSFGKWILALSIPSILALLWGMFNVPGDPSRSGNAPVQVPGYIRLFIELLIFSLSTYFLWTLDYSKYAILFGLAVIFHYLFSLKRMRWLLKN